jgi:putative ABC transport system ATP-binding protein
LFQFGNLLSYLSVYDNIAFPLVLNNVEAKQRRARVLSLLERVGMGDYGAAMPRELSGGETQRVSFARAIAHSPKLLLADEPTANLDTISGGGLMQLMLQMVSEQKSTLLVCTHDPVVMEALEGILHLRDGELVAEPARSNL